MEAAKRRSMAQGQRTAWGSALLAYGRGGSAKQGGNKKRGKKKNAGKNDQCGFVKKKKKKKKKREGKGKWN